MHIFITYIRPRRLCEKLEFLSHNVLRSFAKNICIPNDLETYLSIVITNLYPFWIAKLYLKNYCNCHSVNNSFLNYRASKWYGILLMTKIIWWLYLHVYILIVCNCKFKNCTYLLQILDEMAHGSFSRTIFYEIAQSYPMNWS